VVATRTPGVWAGSEEQLADRMRSDGLDPRPWTNGPGDTYGWHEHAYHKVLYCLDGDIVIHTDDGDVPMQAGDRLDLEPGTRHAATVGQTGVRCLESPR
jgi:quercetin dioxygenase-like cupin family protein